MESVKNFLKCYKTLIEIILIPLITAIVPIMFPTKVGFIVYLILFILIN